MSNLSCPFPKSSQSIIKEYIVLCCFSQGNYICIPNVAIYIIKTIRWNLCGVIFIIQSPFSFIKVVLRFARQQLVLLKSTSRHSTTSWRSLALIIQGQKYSQLEESSTDTKISKTLNRWVQPLSFCKRQQMNVTTHRGAKNALCFPDARADTPSTLFMKCLWNCQRK